MGNPLQQRRSPQEFAENGQVIEIDSKVSDFERLAEAIALDLGALAPADRPDGWCDANVGGSLRFGFVAAQGEMPAVAGQVDAAIAAVCQRCLRPFTMPLHAELRLVFGDDSDAEGYEFWELQGGDLCPADLVDEALVMALPFAALHDGDAACVIAPVAAVRPEKRTTPFANLKTQMGREN